MTCEIWCSEPIPVSPPAVVNVSIRPCNSDCLPKTITLRHDDGTEKQIDITDANCSSGVEVDIEAGCVGLLATDDGCQDVAIV